MTTKVYDAAFELSISPKYSGRRMSKAFQTKDATEALQTATQTNTSRGDTLDLRFSISFVRAAEEDVRLEM